MFFKVFFITLTFSTILIWSTSVTKHNITGSSMEPNYESGESYYTFVFKWNELGSIQRGDVVSVFMNPNKPKQNYVKRVIGLPGETISFTRDGLIVSVNGELVTYGNVSHEKGYIHQSKKQHDLTPESKFLTVQDKLNNAALSKVIREGVHGVFYDILHIYTTESNIGTKEYFESKSESKDYGAFNYDKAGLATVTVPSEHYFLLSDNRPSGLDSRSLGFIAHIDIYRVIKRHD